MRTVLAWLTLCTIWSSTWMVIKLGLQDLPPLLFAGLRFIVAFLVLAAVLLARGMPLPARRDWWLIALTGFLTFGVNYGCLFWGEEHVASGLAAVLQSTIPAFGILFAHYHLPAERMTLPKAAGALLGLAGVVIVFSNRAHSDERSAFWGCVAIVFGAFSVAYANVLVKARGAHLDPMTLAAGQMACGLIPLFLASLFLERGSTPPTWNLRAVASLLYLAIVGSALAFYLMYWLLRHTDVTRIMMISLITPVAAVALGMVLLHESFTWQAGAGGGCVLLGIGLVVNPFRRAGILPTPIPAKEGVL